MSDFQLECAEELVNDYYGELSLEEAQKIVSEFSDIDFWQKYKQLKKFIINRRMI